MLVVAGCVGPVPSGASNTAVVPTEMALQNCREFTVQVTAGIRTSTSADPPTFATMSTGAVAKVRGQVLPIEHVV